jgi:hypothetical protein
MKLWTIVLLVACACPSKKTATVTEGSGLGSQTGSNVAVTATTCDSVRGKIEELYRADAQVKERKRVEDSVADNTRMALNDCAKDPAKFVSCIAKAQSVADLEKQCLVPLDDEGTEGEPAKR